MVVLNFCGLLVLTYDLLFTFVDFTYYCSIAVGLKVLLTNLIKVGLT